MYLEPSISSKAFVFCSLSDLLHRGLEGELIRVEVIFVEMAKRLAE